MSRTGKRFKYLPEPIRGLADIAFNVSWSWSPEARDMFRAIDGPLWSRLRHNPIALLRSVEPAMLAAAARDPEFLSLYRRVLARLEEQASFEGTWFHRAYQELMDRPVAYFCAEFGLHNSVPIYSGGLGILAGDHAKAASDLGVPLVCVGLLYSKGYFDQKFTTDGWQVDSDEQFNPQIMPLNRVLTQDGKRALATVEAQGRPVELGVWEMQVGRTRILLLDTDLEQNDEADRELTSKLYGGGQELRLKQEWILGVGGVRVLRAMGIDPGCWHANEGHAAFMPVERLREYMAEGMELEDAIARVRRRSVFTTHTPVPAGHDSFTGTQIEDCIGPVWEEWGLTREDFLEFGRHPTIDHDTFHMTATAIRLSKAVNGVSQTHGTVTRRIWKDLWPGRRSEEVSIGHVTNGVHRDTWMSAPIRELLERSLGRGWESRLDEPGLWDHVLAIEDEELWNTHRYLRRRFLDFIREQARMRFRDHWKQAEQLAAAGLLLDPDALTLGFARRFATYKRADLIFRNEGRLLRLLTSTRRPVQIVFAGKAHPADEEGKKLLQRVFQFARDPRMEGRVAFLEDYEMHLAHQMYEGVDLWLNLPKVPLEASGTSGMKAALNAVPQLGTVDGWWAEGYAGTNGWAIPLAAEESEAEESDWDHLFTILEDEVVPLFYDRDERNVPVGWVQRMKHALWIAGKSFTAGRMVKEYANRYYVPALRDEPEGDDPPTG
jgi:starch phosphorylase